MKKSENLSEFFHNIVQIIQKSLTGGDSITQAEEIIAFIMVTSLIAFILYIVAFCRKTLKPNVENIAPLVIVPLIGIGLIVAIYGYVTEGFFCKYGSFMAFQQHCSRDWKSHGILPGRGHFR